MKVTEQPLKKRVQVVALNEPPVVPGVSVKVTVPVGVLAAVGSATVPTTLTVQLVPPNAIVQLIAPTLAIVTSFATVIVLEVPLLPL